VELFNALELDEKNNNIISIVGAGGKTTTMYRLSKELKKLNKKVLLTTTTVIYYPMIEEYDNLIISSNLEQLILESKKISRGTITIICNAFYNNNKLRGINREWVKPLYNQGEYDFLVIEADGAKRKSIKAPTWYEPVIADSSTLVVGCIGLDVIGKKINETQVHRANIFGKLVGKDIGDIIDYETVLKLVISRQGLFKDCKDHSKKIVILNKVRDNEQLFYAQQLGHMIMKNSEDISSVLMGNVKDDNPIIKIVK
jgi:probable selenium-dependent hydroxylase accessory protein YqeC